MELKTTSGEQQRLDNGKENTFGSSIRTGHCWGNKRFTHGQSFTHVQSINP